MGDLKAFNFGDWGRKYRPQSLEEMILPATVKKAFIQIRDRQVGPHLLLAGPHGSGKTTAAFLMAASAPSLAGLRYHFTESDSDQRALHHSIFRERADWPCEARNVVAIIRADHLNKATQLDLIRFMDELTPRNMFVLTACEPNKIQPVVAERFVRVDFGKMAGDQELKAQTLERALAILEQEQITMDRGVVKAIVDRYFPNIYKVLEQLQFEALLQH